MLNRLPNLVLACAALGALIRGVLDQPDRLHSYTTADMPPSRFIDAPVM